MPDKKIKLSESDIERACTDILKLDGWRALKTNPTSDRARGKGFGEIGMADYLYIRYGGVVWSGAFTADGWQLPFLGRDVMWIEWKCPRGKLSIRQTAWHLAERACGGLTLIAGIDFPATIEGFREWYVTQSGFNRSIRGDER
jgi:hypothetical protein